MKAVGGQPLGIVFDNDGLLLDSEPCWTRARQTLFARHRLVYDLAARTALAGVTPRTSASILARLLRQPESGEQLSDEMYALALEEISNDASPRPGAVELVGELSAAGRPLGVASNAPRRHVLAGLNRVGLQDAFDVVLGVDDVAEPKPAPDLYRSACAALAVAPGAAIALEDSPPGVAAARAAGLRVIGIPSVPGVVLDADLIAASLALRPQGRLHLTSAADLTPR